MHAVRDVATCTICAVGLSQEFGTVFMSTARSSVEENESCVLHFYVHRSETGTTDGEDFAKLGLLPCEQAG